MFLTSQKWVIEKKKNKTVTARLHSQLFAILEDSYALCWYCGMLWTEQEWDMV